MIKTNSIVNSMPKYDHCQHVLSDWLAELDQRFQLGEVREDTNKITWCQLLIVATGSSILSSLDEEAFWEDAKEALLTHLGISSVRDEAWAAFKNLKKNSKDIVELTGEAEKLAKRLHPRDEEAAERHAGDAFLGALDRTLAAEVQKLGHRTMEEVVATARRIEKILEEQTDTKTERLVSTMQDQIRILKKRISRRPTNKSLPIRPQQPLPTPWQLFPLLPSQPLNRLLPLPLPRPLATSTRSTVKILRSTALPCRQMDRQPSRCLLCGEEGHFVSNCPARPVLQRLLHQQARASARGPPRGQILGLPQPEDDSQAHPNVQLNC